MQILVLAGGDSTEREVSLRSGQAVAAALSHLDHHVRLADPAEMPIHALLAASPWDIVFPMVHGTGGEDGQLQKSIAATGLRWVGSSAAASALTFDKIETNTFLRQHDIRVPNHRVVSRGTGDDVLGECFRALGQHVVTKPPRQGSSVGVSVVHNPSDLTDALHLALEYDDHCLVEEWIDGRELTVPVLNGKPLPAVEIQPAVDWYDYAAKYGDTATRYTVNPVDIPPEITRIATAACRLCGVTGIARVDFMVDRQQCPYLLEINTVPGMTNRSLVPMSAQAADLSLGQLCEAAIRHELASPGTEASPA